MSTLVLNNFTNYDAPGYSGSGKYGFNNLMASKKIVLVPVGYTFANMAAVQAYVNWATGIKGPIANRLQPLPLAFEVKQEGGTTKFQQTPLSGKIPVLEEVAGLILTYNVDPIWASLMRGNNFKRFDVIVIDDSGTIMGTTPDGTKFKGLSTTSVFFGQMTFADGIKSAENQLYISFADPLEWNNAPAKVDGAGLSWFPKALDGVSPVRLTCSGSSATGFTVSVNAWGLNASDPNSAYPGLVKADFILTKAGSPVALTGATCTDNNDGTYTFTGLSGLSGAYTVSLVICSAISVVAYAIEVPTAGQGTFTV